MYHHSLDRATLTHNAEQRRDRAATLPQEEDIRRLSFRHKRVLLSRTRLKAEIYLQQN